MAIYHMLLQILFSKGIITNVFSGGGWMVQLLSQLRFSLLGATKQRLEQWPLLYLI